MPTYEDVVPFGPLESRLPRYVLWWHLARNPSTIYINLCFLLLSPFIFALHLNNSFFPNIFWSLSLSLSLYKNKMEGASMVRIDRKSSIESEPRTLRFDQIQYARVSQFMYLLN